LDIFKEHKIKKIDFICFIEKEVKDSKQLNIFQTLEKEILSIYEKVVDKLKEIKTRTSISSKENLIENIDL